MNYFEPIQQPSADEINIGRYVNIIFGWWRLIMLCVIIGGLIAFFMASLLPKMYQAEANVVLLQSGVVVNFDSKIQTISNADPTTQAIDPSARRVSLTTIAQSPDIAQRVIGQIGDKLPIELRNSSILLKTVEVKNAGDLVRIATNADSPDLAALIANTWAQTYTDRINELYGNNPISPGDLQSQVDTARMDYDAAQKAYVAFLSSATINTLTRQRNLLSNQLDSQVTLETKLFQLEQEAKALRGRISSATNSISSGDELARLLLEASAFSNGAVLPVNLQIVLGSGASDVTPADQLRRMDTLITVLEERRKTFAGDSQPALYKELNSVQAALEQESARQKELQMARDLTLSTYQALTTKVAETTVSGVAKGQIVRVATFATISTEPVQSRRLILTLVGGVVGMLLGVALAFAMEYFGGLSDPQHVTFALGVPTLATIPRWDDALTLENLPVSAVEGLRGLRYHLLAKDSSRVVMFTSARPGEGVTTLATSLAMVTAQAGKKVLLLDANLRDPHVHTLLHLEQSPGLADLLSTASGETLDWQSFTRDSRIPGLRVLTAGTIPTDPGGVLAQPALDHLLEQLKGVFELVVVDVPSINDIIDPFEVARTVGGIVLVVDSKYTTQSIAVRAKQTLEATGKPLLGVILNRVRRVRDMREVPGSPTAQSSTQSAWSAVRTRLADFVGTHSE